MILQQNEDLYRLILFLHRFSVAYEVFLMHTVVEALQVRAWILVKPF